MNGNFLRGLPSSAPLLPTDAASKGYVDTAISATALKAACRAAATANITLSGLQTIDTVVLAAGDRVLVKNQTTTSQNGIYVAASGAWARSSDTNTAALMSSAATTVNEGVSNTGRTWQTKFKATDTLGTSGVDWWYLVDNLAGSILYAPKPTGTPDGTKFFRDDNTWAVPPGSGGSSDPLMRAAVRACLPSPITLSGTQTVDGVAIGLW